MNQFPHPARLRARVSGGKRLARRMTRAWDDKSGGTVFVGFVMRRTLPNEKRSYLLIDVSNSFTKFAFATGQRLAATERVETARLSGASIGRLLRERRVDHVVVSSV